MADQHIPAVQIMAPYEANIVAQAEQRRVTIALPALVGLAGLRASINRIDHALSHYTAELFVARSKMSDDDQRPYATEYSNRSFWLAVCVLLALELALNKSALDQLRIDELHAWMTAGFISVMNFFAAKSTARVIRQRPSLTSEPTPWIIALLVNMALITSLGQLAGLRAADAGIGGSALVFLALQLSGYLTVVFLAFHHLDPSSLREQLTKLIVCLDTRVEALWRERTTQANVHNTTHERARVALQGVVHDTSERIFQYRCANMRSRAGEPPHYFSASPSPDLFKPFDLGSQIDAHPVQIAEVIDSTEAEGDPS